MFEKVAEADFVRGEHHALRFWQDRGIFDKLRAQNAGKPRWSFLDGPITAGQCIQAVLSEGFKVAALQETVIAFER